MVPGVLRRGVCLCPWYWSVGGGMSVVLVQIRYMYNACFFYMCAGGSRLSISNGFV